MAFENTSKERTEPSIPVPVRRTLFTRYGVGLGLVLLLALLLDFFQLGGHSFGNLYYAATVKSMLTNWHTFFFASFDPAGYVTVDKPPLGLWIQALSVHLFGFTAFSVFLPQALAGVVSVALLASLLRRIYGNAAALIAALALALTPISVVTNRSNTVDSLLVVTVLLAAWAVMRAAQTGRLRWLLLSAAILGLGFNIKTLEAYLVLPALGLTYLLSAPVRWRTKVFQSVLAILVLLVVSLCWIVTVDVTPANQRPYVGSSGDNSEVSLTFGYNGLARLFGGTTSTVANAFVFQQSVLTEVFGITSETGTPGPLRLFNYQLGGQIGWLLPIAFLGLIAAIWQGHPRFPLERYWQGLVLWGTWFLTQAAFFSVAAFFNLYYMVILAPALCALVGIGTVTMVRDWRERKKRGWLLPIALLGTLVVQVHLLAIVPRISIIGAPVVLTLGGLAIVGLVVAWIFVPYTKPFAIRAFTVLGLLAVLLVPTFWDMVAVVANNSSAFPIAVPYQQSLSPLAVQLGKYEEAVAHPDPVLIQYLVKHQGNARYLVATNSATTAAPIIVATGKSVLALGGFSGLDHILSHEQVSNLVKAGEIHYFLLPQFLSDTKLPLSLQDYLIEVNNASFEQGIVGQGDIDEWVRFNCTPVLPSQWGFGTPSAFSEGGVLLLYACG